MLSLLCRQPCRVSHGTTVSVVTESYSTGVPQAVVCRLHSDRHGIFGAKVAIFFHKAKLWPAFMLSFSYIFILSDGRTKFLWLSLWLFVIYICLIAMAGKESRGRWDMSWNNGPSGGNHYQFTGSHCYAMCCGERRERLSGVWSNCSSRQSSNVENAQRHSACAAHHPLQSLSPHLRQSLGHAGRDSSCTRKRASLPTPNSHFSPISSGFFEKPCILLNIAVQ